MKTKIFIAGILLAVTLAGAGTIIPGPRIALPSNAPIVLTATATNDLTSTLQRGLFEEEGNRDLDAAISAYQSLAAQFDKSRQVAATAIFRLGECYRKLGRTNEAVAQYDRIVREFSDQQTLATLSRQNITGLSLKPEASGPVAASRIAQKRLLEEAIRLAEEDVSNAKKQFEVGIIPEGDVRASELEVLRLRNQMAGLDSGTDTTFIASPTARAKQRQLLEEEIKLVQTMIEDDEKRVKNGVIRPGDDSLYAARRELLSLQLQRVALSEEGAGTQANASGATLDNLQSQYALLKAQLEQARKETNSIFVGRLFDDQALIERATALSHVQENLNAAKARSEDTAQMEKALSSMQQRVEQLRQQLFDYQEKRLDILHSAIQQTHADQKVDLLATENPAATDDEEKEIRRIQAMIQNSPDLINSTASGFTPLRNAVEAGQTRVVNFLLDHSADINLKSGGDAPIVVAARSGNKAMVELLLNRGADVTATGGTGGTALHEAAERGFRSVAEVLLDHHADVNARNAVINDERTPLHIAASRGNTELVKLLVARGAEINARSKNGSTPLDSALGSPRQLESIKALLAAKADPNIADEKGITPLSDAVSRNYLDVVKLFLDAKADPNAGKLNLPLLCAVHARNVEAAELLLKAGANPNAISENDWNVGLYERRFSNPGAGKRTSATPLWFAAQQGQLAMVKLLLQFKADPNDTQTDGQAILFQALQNPEILTALLDAGGNVEARLANDNVPLLTAASWGSTPNSAVVELLLKRGANPNAKDHNGDTPLHFVLRQGWSRSREIIGLLLANKADVNAQNNAGETPLDCSNRKIYPPGTGDKEMTAQLEISALLREHGALPGSDLPHWDRITMSRPSANYSKMILLKGTNEWNRFNLLEAIAAHYKFIQANLSPPDNSLQFPDFAHVTIHRPAADGKSWKAIPVNVAEIFSSGDCSRNVWLEWGDVIEIPEADHRIGENWLGLPSADAATLIKCIFPMVNIVVQGAGKEIKPGIQLSDFSSGSVRTVQPHTSPSFMLRPLLYSSGMIRFSSDLSHVKVTRQHDPTSGKTREWILDCSGDKFPDLWLRDGDVIEVPDKP